MTRAVIGLLGRAQFFFDSQVKTTLKIRQKRVRYHLFILV